MELSSCFARLDLASVNVYDSQVYCLKRPLVVALCIMNYDNDGVEVFRLECTQPSEFFSHDLQHFSQILELMVSFMQVSPERWNENKDYLTYFTANCGGKICLSQLVLF